MNHMQNWCTNYAKLGTYQCFLALIMHSYLSLGGYKQLLRSSFSFFSWPLAWLGKFIPVPETPFSAFFAPLSRCCKRPRHPRECSDDCKSPCLIWFCISYKEELYYSQCAVRPWIGDLNSSRKIMPQYCFSLQQVLQHNLTGKLWSAPPVRISQSDLLLWHGILTGKLCPTVVHFGLLSYNNTR